MSGGPAVEPYTRRTLNAWLRQAQGAAMTDQRGDHVKYRLPNGQVVGTLDDRGSDQTVPTPLAGAVAKSLGMSLAALRTDLGYPPQVRNGPGTTPARAMPSRQQRSELERLVAAAGVVLTTGVPHAQRVHMGRYIPAALRLVEGLLGR